MKTLILLILAFNCFGCSSIPYSSNIGEFKSSIGNWNYDFDSSKRQPAQKDDFEENYDPGCLD